jgi:sugar phosphate isomerase/epimerase
MGSARRDRLRASPNVYLSTWSVHRLLFARAISLESMPAVAAAGGFAGVELEDIFFPTVSLGFVKDLVRRLRVHRQKVLIAVSNDFTVSGPRLLRREIVRAKRFLTVASALESPVVRVLMGSKHPHVSCLGQVRDSMVEILEASRRLHVTLAIENHDRLSRDPVRLTRFVESLKSADVGICLDIGNFPPGSRYRAIERCAPRARMVHAKAFGFRADGEERTLSYRRIGDILKRERFEGPVVVEYEGPGDELLGSVRVKRLVEKHLVGPHRRA